MAGFIAILTVAFLGIWNSHQINNFPKKKKTYLILVFGGMIIYAILRDTSVGIDYAYRYNEIKLVSGMRFGEALQYATLRMKGQYVYIMSIWAIAQMIPSAYFINSLMDVFILCTFAWLFYRYSSDVCLSSLMFLAFCFPATLNITRQYVAAALFIIAIHQLANRHPVKALFPLIIAPFIHSSSFILFFIYVLYFLGFSITREKMMLYLAGIVVFFFSFDAALELFLNWLPQYRYALQDRFVGDTKFSVIWMCIYLVIAAVAYYSLPTWKKNTALLPKSEISQTYGVIIVTYMIYASLTLIRSKMHFVSRIQTFFIFAYCLIIPEVIRRIPVTKKSKNFIYLVFAFVLTIYALGLFASDPHGLLPYSFI